MPKIKVLSVFGTRPEANKMIPLVLALQARAEIVSMVCVTAQHRELLDQSLLPFDIKPDYDLNIMTTRQSLSDIACRALKGLEGVIRDAAPDLLLAHGDTATTFAASLAAFYARVRVGHVEAGLRSYDKYQPYPEEMNRKLTTALADLHFAPTADARDKLLCEHVPAASIFVTGNTGIDLLRHTVRSDYVFQHPALNTLDYTKPVIAMTAHRNENLGEPLLRICHAVLRLVEDFPAVTVVYAVHPNPAVQETAYAILSGHERIKLLSPLGTFDMHNLIRRSYLVLTDSGGLQEEAPALHKPVVVLREVTERPEGLAAGVLTLAGTQPDIIYNTVSRLLTDSAAYEKMAAAPNPFGDGHASERIVDAILQTTGK